MKEKLTLQLTVKAYKSLLRVTTGFVEQSALAFGLGRKESLALTLAAEEIFLYLCHISAPETEVEIRCRPGGWRVIVDLAFEGEGFHMEAFNLTATPAFTDGKATRETGLLLASRMVNRFKLSYAGTRLVLSLIKDKAYPESSGQTVPAAVPVSTFSVRRPAEKEVGVAVEMIKNHCGNLFNPPFTAFPGKATGMVESGDMDAAIAMDEAGHIGGILFWSLDRPAMVECYGPYVFHPESHPEMAIFLLDRCIEEIAHTNALGLLNRYPGTGTPLGYFERLGQQALFQKRGESVTVDACYRLLKEDTGSSVWAHPDLIPFLQSNYEKLVLPREIRPVDGHGGERGGSSVFFVEQNRNWSWATLCPIEFGSNAPEALNAHLQLLKKEGSFAIFFEMDLGHAWQTDFTPALFTNHFEPGFILPYGGEGDLVVFQHRLDNPI